jgi:hypothetical protein
MHKSQAVYIIILCILISCTNRENRSSTPSFYSETPNTIGVPPDTIADTANSSTVSVDDPRDNAKIQAELMMQCFTEQNFECFLSFLPATVLVQFPSQQQALDLFSNSLKEMEKNGKIIRITIGKPSSIITHKNVMQCIVPETIRFRYNNGEMADLHGGLIGVSTNDGVKWSFLDATSIGDDIKILKKYLPVLSDEIDIPKFRIVKVDKD